MQQQVSIPWSQLLQRLYLFVTSSSSSSSSSSSATSSINSLVLHPSLAKQQQSYRQRQEWKELSNNLRLIEENINDDPNIFSTNHYIYIPSSSLSHSSSVSSLSASPSISSTPSSNNIASSLSLLSASLSSATITVDLTALILRVLVIICQQSASMTGSDVRDTTTITDDLFVDADMNDAGLLLSLLSTTISLLLASMQLDLQHFTRTFLHVFSETAVIAALLPLSSYQQSTLASSAALASHTFIHCFDQIHNNIELQCGTYPATVFLLRLLYQWIPHHNLAIVHHQRPPAFSTSNHPHPIASVPSSLSFAVYAELDLQSILRYVCTDVFLVADSWKYLKRFDRWFITHQCMLLFMITLAHPLSVAASTIRAAFYAYFISDRSMTLALMQPMLVAASTIQQAREQKKVEEAQQIEQLLIASTHVTQQLLRMEKASYVVSDVENVEAVVASSFHHRLLVTVIVPTVRPNTASILAAFTAPQQQQPRSLLQALSAFTSSQYTDRVQAAVIDTLQLLITPLAVTNAVEISSSLWFTQLSPVLSRLQQSLSWLLASNTTAIHIKCSVLVFLSSLLQYHSAVAEMLLLPLAEEENKEEKSSPTPIVDTVTEWLSQSATLFHNDPTLLRAVYRLLMSLWSTDSPWLMNDLIPQMISKGRIWTHIQSVLQAEVDHPALISLQQQQAEGEEQRRGMEDEDDEEAYDQQSIPVPTRIQLYCDQLSIRCYALQITTLELHSQSTLDGGLVAFINACFASVPKNDWITAFSACGDDLPLREHLSDILPTLKLNLSACLNDLYSMDVDVSDDPKGAYLLSVVQRILYDDIVAAEEQEERRRFEDSDMPSPAASPPLYPILPSRAPPTLHLLSASAQVSPANSALVLSSKPSLSDYISNVSAFLETLSRLNQIVHISRHQVRLAQCYSACIELLLLKHANLLFPASSATSSRYLAALAARLSPLPQNIDSNSNQTQSSRLHPSIRSSLARLYTRVLYYFCSSSLSHTKDLAASILLQYEKRPIAGVEEVVFVFQQIGLLLENTIVAVLYSAIRLYGNSATNVGEMQEGFVKLLQQANTAPNADLINACLYIIKDTGYDRSTRQLLVHSLSQTTADDTVQSIEVLRSLFSALLCLTQYYTHLRQVCQVIRRHSAVLDTANMAEIAKSAASRPLTFSPTVRKEVC